ncbi:MAG: adenine deaminase [Calditrichia bacterium]
MRNFFDKLRAARGEIPADLLIKNGRLLNVLSGEIYQENIAIYDGRIVGFGDYEANEVLDVEGLIVSPGFIDGHMHFESTMLTLNEFARVVLPHGTTAVVIDPHEIANVLGLDGIRYVLNHLPHLPIDVFVMLPSCVPATPLETSGSTITHNELNIMIHEEKVAGIGEMMNFPAVINGDDDTHWKINASRWKKVDGHAPGVTGKALNAYILSKIDSDHESTTKEEALEKVRKGIHVLIREGTSEKNLDDIIPIVNAFNAHNFSFATDDKHPIDLSVEGHINYSVRKAIKNGLDPILAYQMGTIFTARHYNLKNMGYLGPRTWADFVLISDLENVTIEAVYKKGKKVADKDGVYWEPSYIPTIRSTMDPADLNENDLKIKADGKKIRVIEIIPNQIVTGEIIADAMIENGEVVPDIANDILKIVVIERHKATGNIGKAFVKGLGLKQGAIASTIAHDAHNIVIAGTNDRDIYKAYLRLREIKGGLVYVHNGEIVEELPLPIAGLLSNQPYEEVVGRLKKLNDAIHSDGCSHPNPFMILSFLSLSPIPKLKVTDMGLIDAELFRKVDLFVS